MAELSFPAVFKISLGLVPVDMRKQFNGLWVAATKQLREDPLRLALFIGHPDAGQRSAVLLSWMISCKRHGKDSLAYLRDLLTRLPSMTNQDELDALLPSNWTLPAAKTA